MRLVSSPPPRTQVCKERIIAAVEAELANAQPTSVKVDPNAEPEDPLTPRDKDSLAQVCTHA